MEYEKLERFQASPRFLTPSCREQARQTIAREMAEYEAQGKPITQVPTGASGFRGGSVGIIVDSRRDKPLARKRANRRGGLRSA